MNRTLARCLAGVIAAALTVSACGESARPATNDWLVEWQSLTASLPSEAELGDPPDMELCARTLARIRETAPALRITPELAADAPVEQWISVAEATFFECPPESGDIDGFADAFANLERIEQEVAAGLDL